MIRGVIKPFEMYLSAAFWVKKNEHKTEPPHVISGDKYFLIAVDTKVFLGNMLFPQCRKL